MTPHDDYLVGNTYYFASTPDYNKAVLHYSRAVKNRHPLAMYMLGICCYNGTGIAYSISDAIWYWNMGYAYGEQNHSCYELGCSYYLGEGSLNADPVIAFRFWQMSAANGNVGAMVEVGNSYYHGDGVEKNIQNALEYWCKARRLRKNDLLI
jgi:TPR repeat protein